MVVYIFCVWYCYAYYTRWLVSSLSFIKMFSIFMWFGLYVRGFIPCLLASFAHIFTTFIVRWFLLIPVWGRFRVISPICKCLLHDHHPGYNTENLMPLNAPLSMPLILGNSVPLLVLIKILGSCQLFFRGCTTPIFIYAINHKSRTCTNRFNGES